MSTLPIPRPLKSHTSISSAFFQKLESQFPGAGRGPWYIYAGAVFQALDRMDLIAALWKYLYTSSFESQVRGKAEKLREALVMGVAVVGGPKAINACTALRESLLATAPALQKELDDQQQLQNSPSSSLRKTLSREAKDARGKALFTKIYGPHTDRVLQNLSLISGGDLSDFAVSALYGDVLAEETWLSAKETGLLEFVACFAMGGSAWAQAKGHMYGSRNLGNGKAEILGAMNICREIEKRLGIKANREPEGNWAWLDKAKEW